VLVSPQMAFHEKPSYNCVKYSDVGSVVRPLPLNIVCCCIKKCNSNLIHKEKSLHQFNAEMLPEFS